jgi:hypothetical protein
MTVVKYCQHSSFSHFNLFLNPSLQPRLSAYVEDKTRNIKGFWMTGLELSEIWEIWKSSGTRPLRTLKLQELFENLVIFRGSFESSW